MNRLRVSCFYALSGPRKFSYMLKFVFHESCFDTGTPSTWLSFFLAYVGALEAPWIFLQA